MNNTEMCQALLEQFFARAREEWDRAAGNLVRVGDVLADMDEGERLRNNLHRVGL